MENFDLKRIPFINPTSDISSFSLRTAAIMSAGGKYLMVINENTTKFKHPGGHLNISESLIDGLKRELEEEIGYVANDLSHSDTS